MTETLPLTITSMAAWWYRIVFADAALFDWCKASKMNMVRSAVVALGGLGLVAPAEAEDAVARGAKVVDEWCRLCHLRPGDPPDPDMAPSYEEIVRRPGRDTAYFARFLEEDHFPMTTFRLFDDEKRDVVEYLLFLQRQ